MPKIICLSASPRKSATWTAAQAAAGYIKEQYPETDVSIMSLAGKKIQPCIHCDGCRRNKSWCVIKDDCDDIIQEFIQADGFLILSPVYVMQPTPQLSAFFSRLRPVFHLFPLSLRNKFGGAVAVGGTRNGGQEVTVQTIMSYLATRGINIVSNEAGGYTGGKIWSQDRGPEGVKEDEIGMKTLLDLAGKLAEVVTIYNAGKRALEDRTD